MSQPKSDRLGTTNLSLLQHTQDYLKSLLQKHAPESVLQESWDVFYDVYSRLIRRFILAQGLRGSDVDDCLQEVWSQVATRLVDFEHPRERPGLRAWLYTVVRSKATDLIRQKTKRGIVGVGDETAARVGAVSQEADPAAQAEKVWADAMLHTMLEDLKSEVSETNHRVLCMRFVEQRSVSEVADALGITPEQVRYRQHRMLNKLRARQSLYTGNPIGRVD